MYFFKFDQIIFQLFAVTSFVVTQLKIIRGTLCGSHIGAR